MKKLYLTIIAVIVALFILGVFKDLVIKTVVTAAATQVLGAPVHIDGMSVGIFKQSVRIKGLKVYNPSGFPSGKLIDIEEAGVDYDLSQILKGNLHLPAVILNLKEMNVVKNAEGKLNVDALKVSQKKDAAAAEKGNKSSANMPMQIDVVSLNLGKVTVTDHTKNPADVQTFNLGVNKTYKNIKSAQQLSLLVMIEAMKPTAIKNAAIYGAASLLGVAFLPLGVGVAIFDHFKLSDKFKNAVHSSQPR